MNLGCDRLTAVQRPRLQHVYRDASVVGFGYEGIHEVVDHSGLGRISRYLDSFDAGHDSTGTSEIVLHPDVLGRSIGNGSPGGSQSPGDLILPAGMLQLRHNLLVLIVLPIGEGLFGEVGQPGRTGPGPVRFGYDRRGKAGVLPESGPA
jgi:hypothetical protein